MTQYLIRRLLISIPVLIGITFIAFVALSLAPGDPVTARIDPSLLAQQPPEWVEQQRKALGLDQPLIVRYVIWLGGTVRGDLGFSIVTRRAIADELAQRLPATFQLMGAALLIGLCVGIPLGILSAVKKYSFADYLLTSLTIAMISTPTFFLGLGGMYLFGVYLRILPTADMATLGMPFSIADRLHHLILPASILGLSNAAPLMRYTRAAMLDVLSQNFIRTAHAKGLGERMVILGHVLRNALLPILTTIGLMLPEMVAGAVVTEQIFSWPGMGTMAVRAAADRDPSLLMGVVLVVGLGVLLSNLVTDIAYAFADPRVRYGSTT